MSEHGKGFAVDPRAVHTFGVDFQHDLDVHLSSEKVLTLHQLSDAQLFGARTASPDIHKAAVDYRDKLIQLFDLLDALIRDGAAMSRAAHAIAEAYADADAVSGDDVGKALATAKLQTNPEAVGQRTGGAA